MKTQKIRLEITQLEFAQLYQEAPEGSVLRKILDRKIDDGVKRFYTQTCLKPQLRKNAKKRGKHTLIK